MIVAAINNTENEINVCITQWSWVLLTLELLLHSHERPIEHEVSADLKIEI